MLDKAKLLGVARRLHAVRVVVGLFASLGPARPVHACVSDCRHCPDPGFTKASS